jgi:hypothetical protein
MANQNPAQSHPLPPPQLAGSFESYGKGGKLSFSTVHLFSTPWILEFWASLDGELNRNIEEVGDPMVICIAMVICIVIKWRIKNQMENCS